MWQRSSKAFSARDAVLDTTPALTPSARAVSRTLLAGVAIAKSLESVSSAVAPSPSSSLFRGPWSQSRPASVTPPVRSRSRWADLAVHEAIPGVHDAAI